LVWVWTSPPKSTPPFTVPQPCQTLGHGFLAMFAAYWSTASDGVLYESTSARLLVLAVMHLRREPGYWMARRSE
jgi:hypothetical protein